MVIGEESVVMNEAIVGMSREPVARQPSRAVGWLRLDLTHARQGFWDNGVSLFGVNLAIQ